MSEISPVGGPAHRCVASPAGLADTVIDALGAQIAVLDADGRIVRVNRAWFEAGPQPLAAADLPGCGVGADYLQACDRAQGGAAEGADEAAAGLRAVLDGRLPRYEIRYPCDTPAARRWFLMTVTPLPPPQRGAVVSHTDVTEVVQAESSQRDSERRFLCLFEQSPLGIALIDPRSGTILDCNERYAAIVGHRRDELLGGDWTLITHPDDIATCLESQRRVLSRDEPCFRLHKRYLKPDRSTVWARLTLAPLRTGAGEPTCVMAIVEDVSEQQQASQHLLQTLDSIAEGYAVLGADWRIVHMNAAAERLSGIERVWAIGRNHWELMPELLGTEVEFAYRRAAAGAPQTFEYWHEARQLWFELRCHPQPEGGLSVHFRDITDSRLAEQQLRENEERFRRLFEDTRQPVMLHDGLQAVAANRACLALFGLESFEQFAASHPIEFSPLLQPDGRSSAEKGADVIRIALEQGSHEFEWEHLRIDGTPFCCNVLITAITQRGRQLLHAVLTDITARKRAQEQAEFLAYHDPLTGLPNRLLGADRLQQAIAAARRDAGQLALLHLDLQRFQQVNDTLGHTLGDRLLVSVAQRLSASLRAGDTLCRLSSDEFLVLLRDVSSHHQVANACERLLAQFEPPFELEGVELHSSVSVGIAVYPRDGDEADLLLRHADLALHEAKKAGVGWRFFEQAMNARLLRYVSTREALRQALACGEFELHYQPQLALGSGHVVGVEALIRWRRPGGGLTMPGEFIDVAEDCGLIVPISQWVIRQACRDARAWQLAGHERLVVAVNLSALHFRQGLVAIDVAAALADSGLDPSRLELELTESTLLQHDDAVLQMVADWKGRGIRLAIDDFGTGYSSLSYLRRLAVDRLKIDRSFVMNLHRDGQARAIVEAIVQIADGLGIETLAEGVEQSDEALMLRLVGCDVAQGYLYARPMPVADFLRWLATMPH